MNLVEKDKFIHDLVDNVKKEVLAKVDKLPENWDGIELRWFVREHFDQIVWGGFTDKRTKRFKDYMNTVLVDNLI